MKLAWSETSKSLQKPCSRSLQPEVVKESQLKHKIQGKHKKVVFVNLSRLAEEYCKR